MATSSSSRFRPRRLIRLAGVAVLLGAGLPLLVAPSVRINASAATALPTAQAPCKPKCPPPPPPTSSPCVFPFDFCPVDSPSPEIVVISPVPLESPPPPGIPSYLIGTMQPSPTPPTDTSGSPVPLGGGFNDLPSPNPAAASSSSSNSGGGGLPLPLLLAGFVVLAAAAGAVLYAVAPLGDRFPEKIAGAPVALQPYGTEGSELNVMESQLGPRPGPRRPRSSL